jgi:pimeloyl-ACP methyl ester carboxylesterase
MAVIEMISRKSESVTRRPPVFFLHGAWHGAWCWEERFLPYFASRGFDAYAVSLRGHRPCDPDHARNTARIADYVADVSLAADALPEPPVLVGHSMGGLIVQKYLEGRTAPAAVLMASSPVRGLAGSTARMALRHSGCFLKSCLTGDLTHLIASSELLRESFFSDGPDGPDDETLERYRANLRPESFRAFLDMIALELPRPRRVGVPVLVLGAERDAVISRRETERTARSYGTRAVFIPDTAHDMMLEHTWRDAADAIINWLPSIGL